MQLKFKLNGEDISIEATGGERVIDLLRERLELVGTKEGCGKGECGACTILLNGEPVCSCLLLSAHLVGKEVITIEGVDRGAVQVAFEKSGAVQCGFCSPGMVLSATALLLKNSKPSRAEIKHALSGNLCRCTGYEKIIDAVQMASKGAGPSK
jgi:aerobic-type carbon monoxide dehydrogenase small subunit (CoxS/CutS family)